MKLEQQLVSLKLSKRLKELRFRQYSQFYWVEFTNGYGKKEMWDLQYGRMGYNKYISAYTVAELGEMLPKNYYSFKREDNKYWCIIWHDSDKEDIDMSYHENIQETISDTEADARAKMLIYLKENNLI